MLQRFDITTLPSTPWKNGGGSTREIVCSPPGADIDTFDWRVSIATIARPGPFSVFAGVDRSIMLLEGDGVHLHSACGVDHQLDTPAQPFAFSGDTVVHCTLLGGESTDFNVMTRRGVVQAEVRVHAQAASLAQTGGGLLLALQSEWHLSYGSESMVLSAGQGVWWSGVPLAWQLSPATDTATMAARLVSVQISPMRSA
jgi:uncharacterized protein